MTCQNSATYSGTRGSRDLPVSLCATVASASHEGFWVDSPRTFQFPEILENWCRWWSALYSLLDTLDLSFHSPPSSCLHSWNSRTNASQKCPADRLSNVFPGMLVNTQISALPPLKMGIRVRAGRQESPFWTSMPWWLSWAVWQRLVALRRTQSSGNSGH